MDDFKKEFDVLFTNELTKLLQKIEVYVTKHEIKYYTDYINNIASNGKRIRPYNTALTYTIYGGQDWRDIKNTLIGVELIHLMALIHDDIMDNSDTRHGVMSVHSYIKKDLDTKTNDLTAKHTSNSIAILLGDLVFAWAFTKFSEDNQTKESWNIINLLLEEVILGQMMDVYNPIEDSTTQESIERKMLLKTARYTFTRPLLLGAVLSQADKNQISWITNFGDSVGIIFQMQDDVFDITKDLITLKKNPLGDIRNGVHTLLSNHILQNSTKEEKETWHKWFGNKEINNQEEIKDFLISTGTLNFAEEYINQKENEALESLSSSNLHEKDSTKIKELLSNITKRKY